MPSRRSTPTGRIYVVWRTSPPPVSRRSSRLLARRRSDVGRRPRARRSCSAPAISPWTMSIGPCSTLSPVAHAIPSCGDDRRYTDTVERDTDNQTLSVIGAWSSSTSPSPRASPRPADPARIRRDHLACRRQSRLEPLNRRGGDPLDQVVYTATSTSSAPVQRRPRHDGVDETAPRADRANTSSGSAGPRHPDGPVDGRRPQRRQPRRPMYVAFNDQADRDGAPDRQRHRPRRHGYLRPRSDDHGVTWTALAPTRSASRRPGGRGAPASLPLARHRSVEWQRGRVLVRHARDEAWTPQVARTWSQHRRAILPALAGLRPAFDTNVR